MFFGLILDRRERYYLWKNIVKHAFFMPALLQNVVCEFLAACPRLSWPYLQK